MKQVFGQNMVGDMENNCCEKCAGMIPDSAHVACGCHKITPQEGKECSKCYYYIGLTPVHKVNCNCSCHTPTDEIVGWEEEFDEKFCFYEGGSSPDDIKAFIRQTIAKIVDDEGEIFEKGKEFGRYEVLERIEGEIWKVFPEKYYPKRDSLLAILRKMR